MSERLRWVLLGAAGGAALLGIWAGANLNVAIPAAMFAIGAGGVAAWDTSRAPGRRRRTGVDPFDAPAVGVRSWFTEGSLGKEEIVLLLDKLDRSGPHPALPVRSPVDLRRVVDLSAPEFRRYVRNRLDQIEGVR